MRRAQKIALVAGGSAVVLATAAVLATGAKAQQQLVSFQVKLVNSGTGALIAGGNVTYGATTQVTDATGVAAFVNVPPGPQPLSASAAGFSSYGPIPFTPQTGVLYDVPLSTSGGGIVYGQSFVFQSSQEGVASVQVAYKNQNTIPIAAAAYCTVKNGLQTVSLGQSSPQSLSPGQTATFSIPLNQVLPSGTYLFDFFAVDTLSRPVSVTTSVTATV